MNALPNASFQVYNTYANGSLRLRATLAGINYQWNLNNSPIPGATDRFFIVTQSGNYSLTATKTGCSLTSPDSMVTVNYTGLRAAIDGNEAPHGLQVAVMPNPTTGVLKIISDESLTVSIRDLQGKIVIDKKAATEIDISDYPAGVYLLQLYDQQGILVRNEKIIKN